ncbi:hypothetical protein MKX01_033019 [Papaver californicum]|nr:hypothetical protein MKX01_033019 [Papaver californicum]
MAEFEVGAVPFNSDGWGPSSSQLFPDYPSNVPLASFNRSEKLGRIADWTRNYNNKNRNSGHGSILDVHLDHSVPGDVDGKVPARPKFKERARRDRLYNRSGNNNYKSHRESAVFKSSVDIQPEWNMLDQIPFSTCSKLSFSVQDPEDLLVCGALETYDRSYDRINPKNEKRLERFKNRNFFKVTTNDDPVIRRLANEDKATVFATDSILSTLMCAPRSVYSWDIVVRRVGNKLFFDKRDGSQLDLLSDINSAYSLSVEAAYINQNFSQQVLVRNGSKVGFEEPNPFTGEGGEEVASVAYRYRRWKLDDEMFLVARCEVQSASECNGQQSFMTLNALNEFDPKYSGIDWRKKLETRGGAVLASELKNNANKLAKWTAQALLASADMMKLGYVSRVHPRDHFNHTILSVVGYKPKEFATQINLNTNNMWGIVKSIVDLCMKLKEGKYVLVKDPSKPQVRIYEVPADAFENDYVEEPFPEDEQVQPPIEEEALDVANDVEDTVEEAVV